MTNLPAYNGVAQDESGNLMAGAEIEVRAEVPGTPLVQLFNDPDGAPGHAIGNPYTSADGIIYFHVPTAGAYQIKATLGGDTRTIRFEQIGPPAIQNALGPETEVTTGSHTVGLEPFITIKRAAPTLTEITLPAVADRAALPLAWVDWST